MPQSSLLRLAHKLPYLPGGGHLLDLWGSCAARRCWHREEETEYRPMLDLASVVNPVFRVALLTAAYQSIDENNNGSVDFDEFSAFFEPCATPAELRLAFDLIDYKKTGQVTFGMLQEFQLQFSPGSDNFGGKVGDPEYLEYANLLMGIKLACERRVFMEALALSGESLPPSSEWLMEMMCREWRALPCLAVHWDYVMHSVPLTAEGRRFPNWKGGFSVRDDGHEGMAVEDFLALPEAQEAQLTLPEVVGLRLYTGPGYEALNRSLRANTQRFPVTEFCIDSAVGKLALVHQPRDLLRGLRKKMHPKWRRQYQVYRGIGKKDAVLCDPGFVSTTTDVAVATGADFGGPVVFVVRAKVPIVGRVGFISDGAAVDWVSQYPTEAEVLLPSNTIFVPCIQCKHPDSDPLLIPARKAVYHFHAYYPWDFNRNMPFIAEDYLDCANFLLHHVHQCEVEFLQDCKAGHPVSSLVPYISAPSASTRATFPSPDGPHRFWSAAHGQAEKDGDSLSRLLQHCSITEELRLELDNERWFPETPLPNSPASMLGSSLRGTDAVKLAALRLYTQEDVERLENSMAPRPAMDDGLGPPPPPIAEGYAPWAGGPRPGGPVPGEALGGAGAFAGLAALADNGADDAVGRAWSSFPTEANVHSPFKHSPWDMNGFVFFCTSVAHRLGLRRIAANSRASVLLVLLLLLLLLIIATVPAVVVAVSGGSSQTSSGPASSPSPFPSPSLSPSPWLEDAFSSSPSPSAPPTSPDAVPWPFASTATSPSVAASSPSSSSPLVESSPSPPPLPSPSISSSSSPLVESSPSPPPLPSPSISNSISPLVESSPTPLPLLSLSNSISPLVESSPTPLPLPSLSNSISPLVESSPTPLPLPSLSNSISPLVESSPTPLPLPSLSNSISPLVESSPTPLPLPSLSSSISPLLESSPTPLPPLSASPSPSDPSPSPSEYPISSPSPTVLQPGQCVTCYENGTVSWPTPVTYVSGAFYYFICNDTGRSIYSYGTVGLAVDTNCTTPDGLWAGSIDPLIPLSGELVLLMREVSHTSHPLWIKQWNNPAVQQLEVCLAAADPSPVQQYDLPSVYQVELLRFPGTGTSGQCDNPWAGTACPVTVKPLTTSSDCSLIFDTQLT